MKKRNPNRGIVLSMADAAAISRWHALEFNDQRFYNQIEATAARIAVQEAAVRLAGKLLDVYRGHEGC